MKTIPVLSRDEIQEDRPGPSRNHSRAAHNLSVVLDRFKDRFAVYQQLSLNLDGWKVIPDLCLWPPYFLPRGGSRTFTQGALIDETIGLEVPVSEIFV